MAEIILKSNLLCSAYIQGFFPMPDPDTGEIVWLRPDPRAIIPLDGFHVSKSLRRRIVRGNFRVTFDKDFRGVMQGCADRTESWITEDFYLGYQNLYQQGLAHSVEVWSEDGTILNGGLYGVAINGAFFAESKFHRTTDASKIALYSLVERLKEKGFSLLEVQFLTPHLKSLGAIEIENKKYLSLLKKAISLEVIF